jgi:hypothetical protein
MSNTWQGSNPGLSRCPVLFGLRTGNERPRAREQFVKEQQQPTARSDSERCSAKNIITCSQDLPPYTPLVKTGRPTTRERTPFGQRLHSLREQAGLSQSGSPIASDSPNERMHSGSATRLHSAQTNCLVWLKLSMFRWMIWWELTDRRSAAPAQSAR